MHFRLVQVLILNVGRPGCCCSSDSSVSVASVKCFHYGSSSGKGYLRDNFTCCGVVRCSNSKQQAAMELLVSLHRLVTFPSSPKFHVPGKTVTHFMSQFNRWSSWQDCCQILWWTSTTLKHSQCYCSHEIFHLSYGVYSSACSEVWVKTGKDCACIMYKH